MAAKSMLQPAKTGGWLSGFGNFLGKEFSLWWSTWRWAKQLVLWAAIINGIIVIMMLASREVAPPQGMTVLEMTNEVFLKLGLMATAVGAVVAAQDAIIGERQSGTIAWMLSKPLARPAFVLTKFIAHSVSMVTLAMLSQAAIYVLQMRLWKGESPDLLPFLGGLGLWALSLLFYVALALMLGTFFTSRAAVAGAGIGFLFAGQIVPSLSVWLYMRSPWVLADMVGPLANGQGLPPNGAVPIVVTALLIPAFLGIALWRFQREEF